jgi:hypothetical protein
MSDFYCDEYVYCPSCPKDSKGRGQDLKLTEANYSGCAVDMANCCECGKGYQISYKIDKIKRADGWDGPSRQKRKEEERKRQTEQEKEEQNQYEKLKKKYGGA